MAQGMKVLLSQPVNLSSVPRTHREPGVCSHLQAQHSYSEMGVGMLFPEACSSASPACAKAWKQCDYRKRQRIFFKQRERRGLTVEVVLWPLCAPYVTCVLMFTCTNAHRHCHHTYHTHNTHTNTQATLKWKWVMEESNCENLIYFEFLKLRNNFSENTNE